MRSGGRLAIVVAVLAAASSVVYVARDDGFEVGDTREVTVLVGDCWRPEVEVDGHRWVAVNAVPAAWGQGLETGHMTRVSAELAVFEGSDGERVELSGSEFHQLACPLHGRARTDS